MAWHRQIHLPQNTVTTDGQRAHENKSRTGKATPAFYDTKKIITNKIMYLKERKIVLSSTHRKYCCIEKF